MPPLPGWHRRSGSLLFRIESRGSKWNCYFHRGSAPWCANELKRSVQLQHALSHIDHPQASRFSDLFGRPQPKLRLIIPDLNALRIASPQSGGLRLAVSDGGSASCRQR